MKQYLHYIIESMNAVDNASVIPDTAVDGLKKDIKKLLKKLGISQYTFIGSTARKPYKKETGDIDVIINIDKDDPFGEKLLKETNEKLKALGYKTNMNRGFRQISIPMEFDNGKIAQVDLMTGSKKWGEDFYSSTTSSQFKILYRNMLLQILAREISDNVLEKDEEGNPVTWEQFVINPNFGIILTKKTRWNKNNTKILKQARIINKQPISRDFNELIKRFNDFYKIPVTKKELSSFENIIHYIKKLPPIKRRNIRKRLDKFFETIDGPKIEEVKKIIETI